MKCAIVTPIGPGHKDSYQFCLESINAAWQTAQGPFDGIEILQMWDLEGNSGRSARRNDGIAAARQLGCEWIFFLDADDLMHPAAFAEFATYADSHDAVWGNICEAAVADMTVRLREPQVASIEHIDQVLKADPVQTLQMGHFVRTECAAAVGFDTAMDTGEDFKYYLEVWSRFRAIKAKTVFFINVRGQHSTGPRSATGKQWRAAVERVIRDKVAECGLVADVACKGTAARFRITNPADLIQRHHCFGVFFEQGELLDLARLVGQGKVIVEIGANVGNHVVFYAQHMSPSRIYPFEPNPPAVAMLRENIALNGVGAIVDPRGIGIGLGRESGSYHVVLPAEANLGAARLESGGDIPVRTLDEMLEGVAVDFMKIDVEGMEFDVLEGARRTIAASRPLIYIEVFNAKIPQLEAWCIANRYEPRGEVRCVNAVNFFVAPAEGRA